MEEFHKLGPYQYVALYGRHQKLTSSNSVGIAKRRCFSEINCLVPVDDEWLRVQNLLCTLDCMNLYTCKDRNFLYVVEKTEGIYIIGCYVPPPYKESTTI